MAKRTGDHSKGDAQYNARRREYRAAQRYLKKAQQTSGAASEKNRALAKTHFERALETYDPAQNQRFSSSIINLAAEFGVDIQGQRSEFITSNEARRKKAIERSASALKKTPAEQREQEARDLINNKEIGRRILGGLVDIWRDSVKKGNSAAENRQAIEKAIFEYFGTNSWADVLERLEQRMGNEMFSIASDLEIYDVVRIGLQKHIAGGTLIA